MRIDDAVVYLSVEEGARAVALALVGECGQAAARLEADHDQEALHDFRVALRRLRTILRAFRPSLRTSLSRPKEKRLRRIARTTNRLRDAEVQLAWLSAQRGALGNRQQRGIDVLSEHFAARVAGDGHERVRVAGKYRRVERKLAPRLRGWEQTIGGAREHVPFGAALAAALSRELERLGERLAAIRGAADEENIHRARIAGKRLRYLLEPLRGHRDADVGQAVKQLKDLQDVLGEIRDRQVLAARIASALSDAAAEHGRRAHAALQEPDAERGRLRDDEHEASPRAGLLELDRLARERRDELFARLETEWREGGIEAFAAVVRGIASSLEARAGGRVERQRRYLLSGAPPSLEGSRTVEVTQGWLPGERFREQVRRVRAAGGERYWRALEVGGARSVNAEEETTREVFEALWPLTEGRRVVKRRTAVEEGRRTWNIDEFVDRGLVMAVATLPADEVDLVLPVWLRPLVALEVTDDPARSDEGLACAPSAPPGGERPEPSPPAASR